MDDVSALRRREVETYFGVIARGGPERRIRARSFHVLGEFGAAEYDRLAGVLAEADAAASVSLLGRDAERFAEPMAALADAGHELVCHGHRHVACADAGYDLAHENLARGLAAVEDATGVTPRGYVSPGQDVSGATLRAAADLGLDYVLGRTDAEVPAGIAFREPAHPYDLVYLNEGADPAETFARVRGQTEAGTTHLVHPNMLDYYDATEAFDAWVAETSPVAVGELVDGADGVGLLVDAMRPLRVV
jgi:peptidoglycan/xylan/chitin deacetylase (PgdA/CDA1 family)